MKLFYIENKEKVIFYNFYNNSKKIVEFKKNTKILQNFLKTIYKKYGKNIKFIKLGDING